MNTPKDRSVESIIGETIIKKGSEYIKNINGTTYIESNVVADLLQAERKKRDEMVEEERARTIYELTGE